MEKKSAVSRPLSILIINYEFPPLGGGGGVATYDLALEWAAQGHVDVLTSSFRGLPSYEAVQNIHVHRVRVLLRKSRDAASFVSMLTYLVTAFFRGMRLCRKHRYDVINTHFAVPSGPLGFVLGKLFKIPNVLSLHGGDIYDPSKKLSPHKSFFFRNVVRFILNRADAVVAQSSNTKHNAITYYNPAKEISIIPLAFHPPELPRTRKGDILLNPRDFNCVTIGRIVRRKAMDVIIRALAKIPDRKVRLFVLGDGPERAELQELAAGLGLDKRVTFLGYVANDDKYRYLSKADLFVLTSMHEGFGIVYQEAMFCGLPIVCSNHGGQVDFLEQGENAILIDVGDADACAAAIQRFCSDRKLYERCSRNNRKKIRRYYADTITGQYLDLFRKLAGG
jgi:glycosyltransferase involved in cell wall biosynthesis